MAKSVWVIPLDQTQLNTMAQWTFEHLDLKYFHKSQLIDEIRKEKKKSNFSSFDILFWTCGRDIGRMKLSFDRSQGHRNLACSCGKRGSLTSNSWGLYFQWG